MELIYMRLIIGCIIVVIILISNRNKKKKKIQENIPENKQPEPLKTPGRVTTLTREELRRQYNEAVFEQFIFSIFRVSKWYEPVSEADQGFFTKHTVILQYSNGSKSTVYVTCSVPSDEEAIYLNYEEYMEDDGKHIVFIRGCRMGIMTTNEEGEESLVYNIRLEVLVPNASKPEAYENHPQIHTCKNGLSIIYQNAKTNIVNGYYFAPYTKYFNETSAQELIEMHVTNDIESVHIPSWHIKRIQDSRIYGDSYFDDKGVYLAMFTESDYYKSTHILIQDTFGHDDSEVGYQKNTEFWLPKHCFADMPGYKRMLWNIYVPNINGRAEQEIDCLVISEYGLFCVEVKNWHPKVHFQNIEDEEWFNGKNERHISPLKQNKGHILGVHDMLQYHNIVYALHIPVYNIIGFHRRIGNDVFDYDCINMINNYERHNKYVLIGDENTLYDKIHNSDIIYQNKYLSKKQIDDVHAILLKDTLKSDIEKDMNIKQKIKDHDI